MSTNKTLRIVAVSTAAFLAMGGVAIAKGPARGGHGGPLGIGLHNMVEALNLDEEQQALAKQLKDDARADREDGQMEREATFNTVLVELDKARPDSELLHGLIDQGAARMADGAHARLDGFLELHATFSAEQRATLVSEMESGRDEMQARKEQHRGERGER